MAADRKIAAASPRLAGYAGWCGGMVLSWGGYLLLAGSVSPAQVVAGALLTAGSVALVVQFKRFGRIDLWLQARWNVRTAWALVGQLIPDTWYVTRALLAHGLCRRRLAGRFRRLPLDPGDQEPASVGRRALLLFAASWTPNSIAVCISERDELLLHQLVSVPPKSSDDRAWPL